MLEPIREYGLERLANAGHERETRLRHADFLVGIAERAFDHDDPQVALHHARVSADLEDVGRRLPGCWRNGKPNAPFVLLAGSRCGGGMNMDLTPECGPGGSGPLKDNVGWSAHGCFTTGVEVDYVVRVLRGLAMIALPLGDLGGMKAWSDATIELGRIHDNPHALFSGNLTQGIAVWYADRDLKRSLASFAAALAIAPALPHIRPIAPRMC